MIKVVCRSSIIEAQWTPSPLVSLVLSLHHHPHQFPQLTSLCKFLWTPLLMEAAFAVPNTTLIIFPIPRLNWEMVNLGTKAREVIIKVARRAHARQTLPLLPCGVCGGHRVVGRTLCAKMVTPDVVLQGPKHRVVWGGMTPRPILHWAKRHTREETGYRTAHAGKASACTSGYP